MAWQGKEIDHIHGETDRAQLSQGRSRGRFRVVPIQELNGAGEGWKQAIGGKTIAHERGRGHQERVLRGGWEEARPGFP